MNVTKDTKYIGVNDHDIDLFEGQYEVPCGMAYNSYVIIDEKIAVMDTVDARFGEEWLAKLEKTLEGRCPDYLVVHHMEPDHSSNIDVFMRRFPNATVVASDKAFVMMKQFFGDDYSARRVVVKDGDTLSLGKHTLTFVAAPMVHWPEVIVSYDAYDKTLFSADAFGKFGALDLDDEWECEARRYYFGIVGKYGMQTKKLLERTAELDIARICPLHGPVLEENIGHYIDLYNKWSSYIPEDSGVVIAYASVYGNTRRAAELLAEELEALGCENVALTDLARCDIAEAVEDAFRYDRLVLASTTYNGDVFPPMREFIHELTERSYRNRTVGIIENGSWAPMAAKRIKAMLEGSVGLTFTDTVVTVRSALTDENKVAIKGLAKELIK